MLNNSMVHIYQRSLSFDRDSKVIPEANLGAVYTPKLLADWVANQLYRYLPQRKSHAILDPCCGDGALLASVATISAGSDTKLKGADIDAFALTRARERLPANAELFLTNSL